MGLPLVLGGSLFVCSPQEKQSFAEEAGSPGCNGSRLPRPSGGGESRGGKQGHEALLTPRIGSDSTFFFFFKDVNEFPQIIIQRMRRIRSL